MPRRPGFPVSLTPRALVRSWTGRAGLAYRAWARRRTIDDPELIAARAWSTVRRAQYCLVVSWSGDADPGGLDAAEWFATARVVEPLPPRDGVIVFGTDPDSRKIEHLRRTGRSLLVHQDQRRRSAVTLECRAAVDGDIDGEDTGTSEGTGTTDGVATTVTPVFRPFWRAFWPQGPDGGFVNVRCEVTALEVWDGTAVIAPEPFGRRQARLERGVDGRWHRD